MSFRSFVRKFGKRLQEGFYPFLFGKADITFRFPDGLLVQSDGHNRHVARVGLILGKVKRQLRYLERNGFGRMYRKRSTSVEEKAARHIDTDDWLPAFVDTLNHGCRHPAHLTRETRSEDPVDHQIKLRQIGDLLFNQYLFVEHIVRFEAAQVMGRIFGIVLTVLHDEGLYVVTRLVQEAGNHQSVSPVVAHTRKDRQGKPLVWILFCKPIIEGRRCPLHQLE